ncbi:MFS transporter [Gordoniibacillus kamchatkensis]|uniref:MFS transporter n=1 Tax=Gordoniibacillus kamchatkensis TaxID=1590651 RepID=UPI000696C650|nr:MFS transporter [Paenibacillus sp. VKM B-2647]
MTVRIHLLRGYNFFYFAMFSVFFSFLPVYAAEQGVSSADVGSLMALGALVGVAAQPVWGMVSDRRRTVRGVLLLLLAISVGAGVLLYRTSDLALLYVAVVVMYFFFLPTDPLVESLNVQTTQRAGISFGSVRMFGALGYAVASYAAGAVLQAAGMKSLWLLFLACGVPALALCFTVGDVPVSGKPVAFRELRGFFGRGVTIRFFLMILLIAVPHRMNDSFIGIYVQANGGGVNLVGDAWAVMTVTEVVFFAIIHRFIRQGSELRLIALASALYAVRFLLCVLVKDPVYVVGFQLFQGVTFVLFYSAAIGYLYRIVPEQWKSTGQTMLAVCFFGVSGVVGSFIGGRILQGYGGATLYAVMTAVAAAGCIAALAVDLADKKEAAAGGGSLSMFGEKSDS